VRRSEPWLNEAALLGFPLWEKQGCGPLWTMDFAVVVEPAMHDMAVR
jgi:hypothetical protein